MHGIERIIFAEQLLAIVVRADVRTEKKYNFLTDDQNPLQVGVNAYAQGEVIRAHGQREAEVQTRKGQKVLVLNAGRLRVSIYDLATQQRVATRELGSGDILVALAGAYGYEMLEACQIVEVKMGPYDPSDKIVLDA